ncbi:MAG: PhzF family phenazine biosynthesis protein [Dehalococcoidales bacterium]|jgi:PhzF family phenazine biosynthesis protein
MRIYQVDAFTDRVFKGNPAGVCILPPDKINDSALLQNIALEMNLSETAFVSKQGNEYQLRWFTPETEVKLCGHATLSAAHILFETGLEKAPAVIAFTTLSGQLTARRYGDKIELDFPAYDTEKIKDQPKINRALGITPVFTGMTDGKYLIEIADAAALKEMQPDFTGLKALGKTAFIVTCRSEDPEYDFYSRFFAPGVGINEDPVTGSSHSSLAPYWVRKLGKNRLRSYQASKRGGVLECELALGGRVLIRGSAVTVFETNTAGDF